MSTELSNGVIIPEEYSDDWYDEMSINLRKLNDVITAASDNATDIQRLDTDKANSSDLATVATSGSYTDLTDKPTINDSTITIQKNGSTVDTFTTNGSAKTINIPVPTKTSDLTNDSNFVDTSNAAVASGITSAKVTDYDTHIADTDIHVTTADKNRWNNQTYVFRYSSTALVASSTNSNSLLDNTDNLKVGDKVIDSSGVLFSITAIDTQNSTFTIGTALIDLANDSDVMHLSGNETVNGLKTFLKYITSDGSSTGDEYSSNTRTNLWLMGNRDQEEVSGILFDSYRQNTAQGTGSHILGVGIKENSVRYEGCRFSWFYDNANSGYVFSLRPTIQGTNQPIKYELGNSSSKWSTINGINPGSLSLPNLNNAIDISGYITNFGAGTVNEYTPVADGWISIANSGDAPIFIRVYNDYGFEHVAYSERNEVGGTTGGTYTRFGSLMIPCIKNIKIYIIISPSTSVLVSAKFYPCQGNV